MKDKNRNKLLLTTKYEDTRLSYAPADQAIDESLEDTNEIFKIKSTLKLKNLIHEN
jgi:diketogulonate reductase-like aldo/keto reductase